MRLAILLSGRGSNFLAIHEAIAAGRLHAEIAVVISNRAMAPGLELARSAGYETAAIDHHLYASRRQHEDEVIARIERAGVDFICLAGYMRLLTPTFVERYPDRIVNIHPSLLPAFPGVDAQSQALAHGVRISGCTVHLVDENLDAGPILVQRSVEVREDDDAESLSARILAEEHRAYVQALVELSRGAPRIEGRRVIFAPARD
jgi:phosphoribosylglycinamide formyltransferase-1